MCRANCWDSNDFFIGKTKRRLRDRKTEHFNPLTFLLLTAFLQWQVVTGMEAEQIIERLANYIWFLGNERGLVVGRFTCNPEVPGSNPPPFHIDGFVFGVPEFYSSTPCK